MRDTLVSILAHRRLQGIGSTVLGIGLVLAGCGEQKVERPDAAPVFPDAAPIAEVVAPVPAAGPAYGVQTYLAVGVRGSLEATITSSVGVEFGPALSQVVARQLVWWLNPSRDLLPNDELEVVYELVKDEEPLVHSVWLDSKKLKKSLSAVRFRPQGTEFDRFFEPDGAELEERLVGSPIEGYEQITSLLRDGRGHKGVDFKTPVGTPIVSPFAGTIVRKNWSVRANGDCVDVLTDQGMNAIFLHMNEVAKGIEVGAKVTKGQALGKTGNTGHSTAPHLHYQLEKQKKVLDPFNVHQTERRHLPKEQQAGLTASFERFSRLRKPK
ncbi:MAG: M23 family metallopeptidase [Deltaproteobacteria bacterium]|nr:M23 family metallopeptidase [Deltaproteobacteria bacterium]